MTDKLKTFADLPPVGDPSPLTPEEKFALERLHSHVKMWQQLIDKEPPKGKDIMLTEVILGVFHAPDGFTIEKDGLVMGQGATVAAALQAAMPKLIPAVEAECQESEKPCKACGATGKIGGFVCPVCHGNGQ